MAGNDLTNADLIVLREMINGKWILRKGKQEGLSTTPQIQILLKKGTIDRLRRFNLIERSGSTFGKYYLSRFGKRYFD